MMMRTNAGRHMSCLYHEGSAGAHEDGYAVLMGINCTKYMKKGMWGVRGRGKGGTFIFKLCFNLSTKHYVNTPFSSFSMYYGSCCDETHACNQGMLVKL